MDICAVAFFQAIGINKNNNTAQHGLKDIIFHAEVNDRFKRMLTNAPALKAESHTAEALALCTFDFCPNIGFST